MAPQFKLSWCILSYTVVHLIQQTASQCVVVYVNIDNIDSSLSALDWEGTYTYDGFSTEETCLAYSTPNGQTILYNHDSWSLTSSAHDTLSYATTDTGPPCDPPLGTFSWTHGSATPVETTVSCSYTDSPTLEPTTEPTSEPTVQPTSSQPTISPSSYPTRAPTDVPSKTPTTEPTSTPSSDPTIDPTLEPTLDLTPNPTANPTSIPSQSPVIAPTHAPTEDACSRISLVVLSPSWAIPSTIDGVYYQQTGWGTSDYPWYSQHFSGTDPSNPQASNDVNIYWEDGFWNIQDASNGILIQYQHDDPSPTALTPPHSAAFGDGWQDITVTDNVLWTIKIECGSMTDAPSTDPTTEPTMIPTADPTIEPTIQPTTAEPTYLPTQEPIYTTEYANTDQPMAEETFLDVFNILEWLIIASIPLLGCLICGSLYIWRTNKIESFQKEQQWHSPSAGDGANDALEMAYSMSPKKKKKPKKLHFDHMAQASADVTGTPVHYKDKLKQNEVDFSNALKVVSTHKSNRSLSNQPKKKGYEEVLGGSLAVDPVAVEEPTTADAVVMVNKQDSEFYGNHPIDEIYSYTFTTKPFGMEWKTTKADKKNLYVSKVVPKSQAALGTVEIGSKLISFNGEMIEDFGAKKIYAKLAITDMPLTITFLKPFKKEEDKEGDNDNFVSPSASANPPPSNQFSSAPPDPVDAPLMPKRRDTTPPVPSPPSGSPPPSGAAPDLDAEKPLMPPKTPPIDENYMRGANEVADPFGDPFAGIGPNPVSELAQDDEKVDAVLRKQPTETMMKTAQALIPEVFDSNDVNHD